METSRIRKQIRMALFACGLYTSLSACAIQGYPKNPEDTDATLSKLNPAFDGTLESKYDNTNGDAAKTPLRNRIIFDRLRAYDIEFSMFERGLYSQSNGLEVGSDLTGLVLGGLTATVGGAATKAALGAASTGVIGANTAINKDLYYQKTIMALLTQMEADRLKAELPIAQGLGKPDSEYSLFQAYLDLDAYNDAGGLPSAISVVTQSANTQKQDAQDAITFANITVETPAIASRYDILTNYIAGLAKNNNVMTLTAIANALGVTVAPGATAGQIKGGIVDSIYADVDEKTTDADKQQALDDLAAKLKNYVKF